MLTRKKKVKDSRQELPSEGEEIYVLFEMPSGRLKWWPTTVEEIHPSGDDTDLLARGTVMYHAVLTHLPERFPVEFYNNRVVRTRKVKWNDFSWRLSGESGETPLPSRAPRASSARHERQPGERDEEEDHVCDNSDEESDDVVPASDDASCDDQPPRKRSKATQEI